MGKLYDELLTAAIDLLPEKVEFTKRGVATACGTGDAPVRLDRTEMARAAEACARQAVRADPLAMLRILEENPALLEGKVTNVQYSTIKDVIADVLMKSIVTDMSTHVQEAYSAQFEGVGRADLVDACKEAIIAAGRVRANRMGFDTSRFEQRVAEFEDSPGPNDILRLFSPAEDVAGALRDRDEGSAARRLMEIVTFAVHNRDRFAPDAAPRP